MEDVRNFATLNDVRVGDTVIDPFEQNVRVDMIAVDHAGVNILVEWAKTDHGVVSRWYRPAQLKLVNGSEMKI